MNIKGAISEVYQSPKTVVRWVIKQILNRQKEMYNTEGLAVFQEDWDNLIILDACRFDSFKKYNQIDGELSCITSRGSTSAEFIRGNFFTELHDVVYVSANEWFRVLQDEIGGDVHRFIGFQNNRNAPQGLTTRPETVAEGARDAIKEYPNKRLVIHFMQPHQPYLGPTADTIEHGNGLPDTIQKNNLSRREVNTLYHENLDLVLDIVEGLLNDLVGKTVITADHGELLGERLPYLPVRDYEHWYGLYVPELLDVPWLEISSEERRTIIEEEPKRGHSTDDERLNQHLRDLGYKA